MQLSATMTVDEFENRCWYATELKQLATQIGVKSASKLGNDQQEQTIAYYLQHDALL
jgi:hypothetical protein